MYAANNRIPYIGWLTKVYKNLGRRAEVEQLQQLGGESKDQELGIKDQGLNRAQRRRMEKQQKKDKR